MSGESNARYLVAFAALAVPFYLNDFASITVKDWRWWLAIDYVAVKLFPLAVIAWLIASRRMTPGDFGLVSQPAAAFLATVLLAALAGTLIDQNAYALLAGLPGFGALGGMPEIRSDIWNRFDLSVGLLLVGFLEELVFRAYAHTVIRRYTASPAAMSPRVHQWLPRVDRSRAIAGLLTSHFSLLTSHFSLLRSPASVAAR